jgi:hypothetical protein
MAKFQSVHFQNPRISLLSDDHETFTWVWRTTKLINRLFALNSSADQAVALLPRMVVDTTSLFDPSDIIDPLLPVLSDGIFPGPDALRFP